MGKPFGVAQDFEDAIELSECVKRTAEVKTKIDALGDAIWISWQPPKSGDRLLKPQRRLLVG